MEWIRDIPIFMQVFFAICTCVVSLAAAVAVVVKLWKWLRRPNEETQEDLKAYKATARNEHEEVRDLIKKQQNLTSKAYELLDNDKKRLDDYDNNFKVLYRGLWVILDHEITGNSDKKMRDIRDELQSHIINT